MALPWLMPAAFECLVVIGGQGGKRTPDTRITNPFVGVLTGVYSGGTYLTTLTLPLVTCK
jgi:hypothetical protein